ncbi:hypothetical protein CBR65_19480 [Cellvibrio sp. PSBB006]|nr:hypothetical protein CBR65_19480 [Cellvibrio sp. PSBB006]
MACSLAVGGFKVHVKIYRRLSTRGKRFKQGTGEQKGRKEMIEHNDVLYVLSLISVQLVVGSRVSTRAHTVAPGIFPFRVLYYASPPGHRNDGQRLIADTKKPQG